VTSRRTLIVVAVATAMLMLDIAVVNTALSPIARDLRGGLDGLEWIVDAYTLALATAVLSCGSLADRFGRRRTFRLGLAMFSLASLGCGLSPSLMWLDAVRALQGLGAAAMFATSLALLSDAYPDARTRGAAFATVGATIGATFAIGPLIGGLITTAFGWRWIFFLNIPLGAVLTLAAGRAIRESSDPFPRPVDLPGQGTFAAGMLLVVLGLLRGGSEGWGSPIILAQLASGGALLALFVGIERRSKHPMLPIELFASRRFTTAQVTVFAISASFFAIYLYITLYLEEILHLSAISTGLVYLPATTLMFLAAGASIQLARHMPQRIMLAGSLALVGLGIALLLVLEPGSSWLAAEPGLTIAGLGGGVFNAVGSELAMSAVPERHAGLASGINDTFRQGAIPLGVAVYGTLIPAGAAIGRGSALAFVAGFHHALLLAVAIAVAGACTAHRLLGGKHLRGPAGLPPETGLTSVSGQ